MSPLTAAREQLKTTLSTITGVSVHDTLPEKVAPPAVVVLPDEPYIDTAADQLPYGYGWARFQVALIVGKGTTPKQYTDLDDLIGQALEALYGDDSVDWTTQTVDEPTSLPLNSTQHLHTRMHVRATWHMRTT